MPYPTPAEYACAFFDEAVRHLTDAHILHVDARYAACVQSCTHASEKAVKAQVFLRGGWYWTDKLKTTHEPLMKLLRNEPLLRPIYETIRSAMPPLESDIKLLEEYTPSKERENCEYPYLAAVVHRPGSDDVTDVTLKRPELEFSEAKSLAAYCASYRVVRFVQDHNAEFQNPPRPLPPAI